MHNKTRKRLKVWSLAFGFWTLLALSYALSAGLAQISEGNPPTWTRMVLWNLTNFWLWMLLVPVVAWLGRYTAGRGWSRFFMVHVPAGLAIALAQVVARISTFWALCGPRQPEIHTLGQYMQIEFVYNYHLAVLTYWVVLAVLRGMESQRRLRDERLRTSQLETQLAQSQLQALRMQLQPHFLFNTLNSISALVLSEPSRARLMIARLGDFLRLTLEERHLSHVPLSRELQFLECYLAIQQVRFQDRLTTRLDIADDTLNASIPNLILQPLVENALRHGLLPKAGTGTLRLTSRRDGEHLHLLLEDDGLGLPEKNHREGIGLSNTRARLKALFDEAARLDLTPVASGGTRVELRFPFQDYAV